MTKLTKKFGLTSESKIGFFDEKLFRIDELGGSTREELDVVCVCGHTREFHTVKDTYCFQFNNNNSCGCKKFKEEKA